MKKCPFCGEEIQDSAKKCKFCGEWLEKTEKSEKKEVVKSEEPSLKGSGCIIIFVILAIFVISGIKDEMAENPTEIPTSTNMNDFNNMLYNDIPAGDEDRQKNAVSFITSRDYKGDKIGALKKELSMLEDRINADMDVDKNRYNLLVKKTERLDYLYNSSDSGFISVDAPEYIYNGDDNATKIFNNKYCINPTALYWKYVHLQELRDKGSISEEEFNTEKKKIANKNEFYKKEIDKLINLDSLKNLKNDDGYSPGSCQINDYDLKL